MIATEGLLKFVIGICVQLLAILMINIKVVVDSIVLRLVHANGLVDSQNKVANCLCKCIY